MNALRSFDPVRVANAVRQLIQQYPVECASALASNKDAILMVGPVIAELAKNIEAADILRDAIAFERKYQLAAAPFYAALRRIEKPFPKTWSQPYAALALGTMLDSVFRELLAETPAAT